MTVFPNVTGLTKNIVMKKTLEWAYASNKIPTYNLPKSSVTTIISLDNVDKELISKIYGNKLISMKQSAIQEKADKEGDFTYLRFNKISVGFFKCIVRLDYGWAISKNSNNAYLSGGGVTFTYYNIFGFWIRSSRYSEMIS